MAKFEHHLFVCINERDKSASRPSCGNEHGKKLKGAFKDAIKDAGLKGRVRVTEVGCLDQCDHAAVMVVYPDAVWYGFVHSGDAEEIVQEHLVNCSTGGTAEDGGILYQHGQLPTSKGERREVGLMRYTRNRQ